MGYGVVNARKAIEAWLQTNMSLTADFSWVVFDSGSVLRPGVISEL